MAAVSLSQGSPPETERRRGDHVRVPLHVLANTDPMDSAFGFQGYTVNISSGGLCVLQERPLPSGTRVRLTLRLHRHLILSLLGTVLWTQPLLGDLACRVGVAFQQALPAAVISDIAVGRY